MTLEEILTIIDKDRDIDKALKLLEEYFNVNNLKNLSESLDVKEQILYNAIKNESILSLVRSIEKYCSKNNIEHSNLTEKLENEANIDNCNKMIQKAKDQISEDKENYIDFSINTYNESDSDITRELRVKLNFKKEPKYLWNIVYITDEFNEYELI